MWCAVLGWLAHSLTTSSLLSAVGLSAGPVGTVATSAGIKWITKDGIGTLGRFFVGGRLAQEFDDDPRFWRMAGEGLSTLGAGLEIATVAYPQQFLLLASAGNFTHALSKSLGRPVFRVIQTHFAASNNVGAVAAKEEVWEVSAELVGTVSSLALLNALAALPDDGSVDKATITVTTWAFIQAVHVGLRYLAMKSLQFPTMSEKRVRLLVTQHVRGQPLSSVKDANKAEPMFELYPKNWVPFPKVHLGTESVQQCLMPSATATAAPAVPSFGQPSMASAGPWPAESTSMHTQDGQAHAEILGEAHQPAGVHQAGEAHVRGLSVSGSPQPSLAHFGHSSSGSSSGGSEASSSDAAPLAAVSSLANHPQSVSGDIQGSNQLQASHSPTPSSSSPQAADTRSFHTSSTASPSPLSPASLNSTGFPLQDRALSSAAGAASTSASSVSEALQRYLALYSQEQHVLVWRGGEAHVLLHEDAGPHALLQAMWQAAWLHRHQEQQQQQQQHVHPQGFLSGTPSPAEEASVQALRQRYPSFAQEAGGLGYQLDRVSVHRGTVRVRVGKQ
ncbi:vitamin B6 photo-protection and homoeostasis-domain-containing protein [Dunaliella salina]|uniref:Vitamin B6 photo-protection and homoeostasis-domain-containing protein n=1 Tax=Dunaliella salina TaxID=3046 RepID=A0ABQ7GA41_DUNSA|nr:vitamin B6 photo-protection and homoeostasis-domain-containing protein [Dunaliella salina]|eukprot:KAF5831472.1 vitamin B6 photo-protection and homoeostasis-domain-containing protein [Dunaliella salina]